MAIRGYRLQVLVFDNACTQDYTESWKLLRKKGWLHYRSPRALAPMAFQQWAFSFLKAFRARHFVFLPETAQLCDDFMPRALGAWKTLSDPRRGALSLVGVRSSDGPLPRVERTEKADSLGAFFLTEQRGVDALQEWAPERGTLEHDFKRRGMNLYRVHCSLVNTVLQTPKPLGVRSRFPTKLPRPVVPKRPIPEKAPRRPQTPLKRAAFFVPTTNRPKLLAATLRSLSTQIVPEGWEVETVVIGMAPDPGRNVAYRFGARYLVSPKETVTTKLNTALKETDAELVLLADDDDIQPPNRLKAAIDAYLDGATWAGSGTIIFYDPDKDRAMNWVGRSSLGLVGTSLSFRTPLLRQVGGWPERKTGKDGPLARRISKVSGTRYADITDKMGRIVCLQHGSNIWKRPVVQKGQATSKGRFRIAGLGTAKEAKILHALEKLSERPRIHVSITTCERPQDLLALLQDIDREREAFNIRVTVYDDASTANYAAPKAFMQERGWEFVRQNTRGGKHGYVALMSTVLSDGLRQGVDYRFFIQDDIRLCVRFFGRTTQLWDSIEDPKKATLFLLRDDSRGADGVAPWTGATMVPAGKVNRTQWVDGNAFLYGPNTQAALPWGTLQPPPPRWYRNPLLGSGFGRQLSKGLVKQGFNLFQARESYVEHLHRCSIMNPLVREADPLSAVSFVDNTVEADGVTVSLASIPSRHKALREVIRRLIPQADRINVYLNGYGTKPDFLDHPKVVVEMSETCSFGDQGDAGKFFWADEVEGYHLVVDDDVAYPEDFVQTLIRWVERYERRAVVGCHGVVLREPFKSYYGSRTVWHFKSKVEVPVPVQCIATNSCCYHTSTITVRRVDFKHPNMADIWLAILGQQQQVPFVCIPHKAGWLDDLSYAYDANDSIYAHSKRKRAGSTKNTADIQTATVKASLPWHIQQLPVRKRPTRKAAFLVPATRRPEMLGAALASLQAQTVPEGWGVEILVGGHPTDPSKAVAESSGATYVEVKSPYPGSKLNACAARTTASLLLAADDDDIQSPHRLAHTIRAVEGGARWVSCSAVWFWDLEHLRLSRWEGPPHLIGTTTAVTSDLFHLVGGWPGVSKGKEDLFTARLAKSAPSAACHDLGSLVGLETVCLQHSTNIWSRPFPEPGTSTRSGVFHVKGVPPTELPEHARQLLKGLSKQPHRAPAEEAAQ